MNNNSNCNANVSTQGCIGDPRFFRITLEGSGCGCGTNSNSDSDNGSLLINSNHFFATTEERDAYFVENPAELQEGILVSAADKFYMLINGAWVEKTAVVQGSQGEQGIQGETGLSAYEIAVKNGYEGTEQEWLDNMTTIEITAYSAWKSWQAQDPMNNTATFDEWVSEKIEQSLMLTDIEAAMQKAALQWAKAELGIEYWTGKYNHDGKKIYGKKINVGTMPSMASKNVPCNISNLYTVTNISGFMNKSGGMYFMPLPYIYSTGLHASMWIDVQNSNVTIITEGDFSACEGTIYIEYTCTDR